MPRMPHQPIFEKGLSRMINEKKGSSRSPNTYTSTTDCHEYEHDAVKASHFAELPACSIDASRTSNLLMVDLSMLSLRN